MPSRKGSPNKNKAFLLNKLQEMYGDDFNPVLRMAENAVELQKLADIDSDATTRKAALDGWDKDDNNIEPKLKAVEVSGELEGKVQVKVIDLTGNADRD